MTILLALLYPIAIQYERGGWWYAVLPFTALALILDVLANHTELALLFLDWPEPGEWTFSQRLKRLRYYPGWRGDMTRPVVKILNVIAPSGKHI